ncbi:hypothetical protein EST38_g486 [Candolleomyces aberdarensis]|uniref:Uncharacterized protein n=1 Tax=Candolleomyces aberdarensis TaxID=2316362 RepID=A0A4Q2DXE2_9AGAR|nr:hypothetical protein EST38_g486 [Candolleomyces aberdarensis]
MSSARLARSVFHAATRRATSSAPNAARAMGRRTMASSAEGAASKKSDTPWIVGSALVFGPAFLYLVSPSARKSAPAHHDKHDSKAHEHPAKEEAAAAPAEKVTLKDDEGKEADVTASLALAEQSNVPKADVSPEQFEETKAKAEEEGSAAPPAEGSSSEASSEGRTDKSGTFQKPGSEGPTDQKVAEEAAQKGQPPKKQAEGEVVKPEEKS